MTTDISSRDNNWVELIQKGDMAAFEAMFRTYYQDLVAFLLRYVKRTHIAEELTQETFANIWEQRETWKVRISLRAYLYGAVRNQAISYLKLRSSGEERWDYSQLDAIKRRDRRNSPAKE